MLRILKRQPKTIYGKVQPSSLLRAPIYHSCRNEWPYRVVDPEEFRIKPFQMRRTNYMGIKSGGYSPSARFTDTGYSLSSDLPSTNLRLFSRTLSTMALPSLRKEMFEVASDHGGKKSKARDAHPSMAQKNSAAWVLGSTGSIHSIEGLVRTFL